MNYFNFLDVYFEKYQLSKSEQSLVKFFVVIITAILFIYVIYQLGYLIGILIATYQNLFNSFFK